MVIRGLINLLLLLPTLFAYSVLLSWLILVFFLPNRVYLWRGGKGVLSRLLGDLISVFLGGISIRLGYWFAVEGFTVWQLLGHQFMYPIIGWIYMVAGGLAIVIRIWDMVKFWKTR